MGCAVDSAEKRRSNDIFRRAWPTFMQAYTVLRGNLHDMHFLSLVISVALLHSRVSSLQSIPGVPKIKENYNPATWMLDISTPSVEAGLGVDYSILYKESHLYK